MSPAASIFLTEATWILSEGMLSIRQNPFLAAEQKAVKTQVYCALITYTLIALIKEKLKSGYSTCELLQISEAALLDKTPVNQLRQKKNKQNVKELLAAV